MIAIFILDNSDMQATIFKSDSIKISLKFVLKRKKSCKKIEFFFFKNFVPTKFFSNWGDDVTK